MSRGEFRGRIEVELGQMGYGPRDFMWAEASQLVVIVGGELRKVTLRANMAKAAVQRVLGRLEGWREMCG
jgi:hypothetical protein